MVALGGNAALVKWRLAFGVWRYSTQLTFSQNSHLLTLGRWIDRIYEFQHEKVAQDTSCTEKNPLKNQINLLRAFFSRISRGLTKKTRRFPFCSFVKRQMVFCVCVSAREREIVCVYSK